MLDRTQGGTPNERILKIRGRYADSPDALTIALTDHGWFVVGTTADRGADADWLKVRDFLILQGAATVQQMAHSIGVSDRMVRKNLDAHERELDATGAGHRGDPRLYRLRSTSDSGLGAASRGGLGPENESVDDSIPDQPRAQEENESANAPAQSATNDSIPDHIADS